MWHDDYDNEINKRIYDYNGVCLSTCSSLLYYVDNEKDVTYSIVNNKFLATTGEDDKIMRDPKCWADTEYSKSNCTIVPINNDTYDNKIETDTTKLY